MVQRFCFFLHTRQGAVILSYFEVLLMDECHHTGFLPTYIQIIGWPKKFRRKLYKRYLPKIQVTSQSALKEVYPYHTASYGCRCSNAQISDPNYRKPVPIILQAHIAQTSQSCDAF